jgi:hypothetical protein
MTYVAIAALVLLGLGLWLAVSLRRMFDAGPALALHVTHQPAGTELVVSLRAAREARSVTVEWLSLERGTVEALGLEAPPGFGEQSLATTPEAEFETDLEDLAGARPAASAAEIDAEHRRQYQEHVDTVARLNREHVRFEGRLRLPRGGDAELRIAARRLVPVPGRLTVGYRARIGLLSYVSGQTVEIFAPETAAPSTGS